MMTKKEKRPTLITLYIPFGLQILDSSICPNVNLAKPTLPIHIILIINRRHQRDSEAYHFSGVISFSLLIAMGATTITQELTCPIAPARMFKALIVESNTLIPKLLPQFIKSVELVQGNGGAGSIEQVNFTEGTYTRAHYIFWVLYLVMSLVT